VEEAEPRVRVPKPERLATEELAWRERAPLLRMAPLPERVLRKVALAPASREKKPLLVTGLAKMVGTRPGISMEALALFWTEPWMVVWLKNWTVPLLMRRERRLMVPVLL
jgi:hypothetical protein